MNRFARRAAAKHAHLMQRLLDRKAANAIDIAISWREPDGGQPAGHDPQLESSYAQQYIPGNATLRAFVHVVSPTSTGLTRFREISLGDVILDFTDPIDFTGKIDVVFTIGGKDYVQKDIGTALADSFSLAREAGATSERTLLLTLAQ